MLGSTRSSIAVVRQSRGPYYGHHYGQQQGTTYNGNFECMCYHPLFLFNQFGDLERAMPRRGNPAGHIRTTRPVCSCSR